MIPDFDTALQRTAVGQKREGGGRDDRKGQKEAKKNDGAPGTDEQKNPNEVCLQFAPFLLSSLLNRITCLSAIMYLGHVGQWRGGGGTKHSRAIT